VLGTHLGADGRLARASLDGELSDAVAALEDTGMLAGGLIRLALATGEVDHARTARTLLDAAIAAASGADVPFAGPGGPDPVLAARGLALPADPAEGATPSGMTACAEAAFLLYALGAGDGYRQAAERAMRSVAGIAVQRPIAFGGALEVMARLADPLVQLVTVVPEGGLGHDELLRATRRHAASVSTIVTERQARRFADAGFELFAGRTARGDDAAAYRCRAFVCALPVATAGELRALGAGGD
jgi:uncharacterized protein YyaL (SSP411 family)